MSMHKMFGKLLAIAVGLLVVVPSLDVDAKPRSRKKAPAASTPGALSTTLRLRPRALNWGMSAKQVAKVYDKVIDKDFLPQYQKVQPGIQMKRLDDEVAYKKASFRRSTVEFGELPTRYDGSAFAGEFTYRNKEFLLELKRKIKHRHFFFIRNQLWKVVDVYLLGPNSKYGSDFKTAAAKIEKKLGVKGFVVKANAAKGVRHNERQWTDKSSRLRVVDWGKDKFAVIYASESTLGRLDSLRTNKPVEAKGKQISEGTKAHLR